MRVWYAVVNDATGAVLSFTTELPTQLPTGLVAVLCDQDPGSFPPLAWDPTLRKLVLAPPIVRPIP